MVMEKSPALVPERAMLEMVTPAVPVLVMEMRSEALVLPMVTVLKSRVSGASVSTRFVFWPVPDSPTTSGLPVASLATDSEAALAPVAPGVNVKLTLQLAFAASVAGLDGQLFAEMLKSPLLVPVSEKPLNVIAVFPVFVSWTDWALLVVFTFCAAKVRLVGFAVRVLVTTCAVPESGTDCGLPEASSVKTMLALREPLGG